MGLAEIQLLKEKAKLPKPKKVYKIAKKSAKRIAQEKEWAANSSEDALDKWFEERRQQMTGKCVLCSGKTEKYNDATYRNSIHHLFDKRKYMFPSVKTHPDNWLELCYYGNSCHANIHNGKITWELLADSKEWNIIVEKFKKIYPFIAEKERYRLPDVLLQYIKNDK